MQFTQPLITIHFSRIQSNSHRMYVPITCLNSEYPSLGGRAPVALKTQGQVSGSHILIGRLQRRTCKVHHSNEVNIHRQCTSMEGRIFGKSSYRVRSSTLTCLAQLKKTCIRILGNPSKRQIWYSQMHKSTFNYIFLLIYKEKSRRKQFQHINAIFLNQFMLERLPLIFPNLQNVQTAMAASLYLPFIVFEILQKQSEHNLNLLIFGLNVHQKSYASKH